MEQIFFKKVFDITIAGTIILKRNYIVFGLILITLLYIWVPPETKSQPSFLKSNFHLLLRAFSLFESIFSHLHRRKFYRGENYWKKNIKMSRRSENQQYHY
jgi:hypothetical protein